MTGITVRKDRYRADICLDLLPELPLSNIRKLFQIMLRNRFANNATILTVTDWLPGAVLSAKADWATESSRFGNGWRRMDWFTRDLPRTIPPKQRRQKIAEQRRRNRELTSALKAAKGAYERLVKIQNIFNETKEKYYA